MAERFLDESAVGWSWVPAQWNRQPEGWVFQEGYWDRTLENRGTLFSPAQVTATGQATGPIVYQPVSQVSPQDYGLLYGAYGRPNSNYDGYPGVTYDNTGQYYGYGFLWEPPAPTAVTSITLIPATTATRISARDWRFRRWIWWFWGWIWRRLWRIWIWGRVIRRPLWRLSLRFPYYGFGGFGGFGLGFGFGGIGFGGYGNGFGRFGNGGFGHRGYPFFPGNRGNQNVFVNNGTIINNNNRTINNRSLGINRPGGANHLNGVGTSHSSFANHSGGRNGALSPPASHAFASPYSHGNSHTNTSGQGANHRAGPVGSSWSPGYNGVSHNAVQHTVARPAFRTGRAERPWVIPVEFNH